MSQSTLVGVALLFAFLVYITIRGELPTYLGLLGIGTGGASGAAGATGTAAGAVQTATGAVQQAGALSSAANQLVQSLSGGTGTAADQFGGSVGVSELASGFPLAGG